MSAPDVEIITYGGGDLLWSLFNAISMLFYGKGQYSSVIQPLCVITAMIGGTWGVSKCFFQPSIDSLLTKYFLPLLAVPYFLIAPQANVHIIDKLNLEDKLNGKPLVVAKVPLIFAKIAGITSYWGYVITEAIENVMHTPNDAMYSKTGKIFGAETALDFSRLRLNNATQAQNIHHFTQQCIIYDIALGRYSIDELRKTSNLLPFLADKTSVVRMIPYVDPISKKMDYVTCKEAIGKMNSLFDEEVAYYTKHEMLKSLPIAYQTLVDFKNHAENKISGQMSNAILDNKSVVKNIVSVNAFNDAAARFATERARDNQRAVYQTAGSIAGTTLVTMRIIFEALIYASFVLILPLSMIPGGIKFIGNWIFLNVWIQLWPPLYGIINYITMLCAQKYAQSIMGDISGGYSLFTSAGFQDLALDTAALGGFLSLSVPVLSFYLLQNLQSMAHLSGSLMTPAHSSAITAASELTTGNYSFANTSMGQVSYDNQTSFQQNNAPTLSSGFFTDNYGTYQVKHGREHITVNQDPSHLNTSISTAEAYSNSLQNAKQNAKTMVDGSLESYTQTRGIAERSTADFIQHVASSDIYSNGYSTTETLATQNSANFVVNAAESWGSSHGLSSRDSLEHFASLGLDIPIISIKGGHSESCSALSDDALQEAKNIFESEDFQHHYQQVINSTMNESTNNMTDEGRRFAENFSASTEKLKSSQDQVSIAHSELNQISENLNYVQSHTSSVNTNLNTEFSNWLNDRGALSTLFDRESEPTLNVLRNEFIEEKCRSEMPNLQHYREPAKGSGIIPSLESEWDSAKNTVQQRATDMNLSYDQNIHDKQRIAYQYDTQSSIVSHALSSQQNSISHRQDSIKEELNNERKKSGHTRLNNRVLENGKHVKDTVNTLISDQAASTCGWFESYSNSQP